MKTDTQTLAELNELVVAAVMNALEAAMQDVEAHGLPVTLVVCHLASISLQIARDAGDKAGVANVLHSYYDA